MQAPERARPRSGLDARANDGGLPWVRLITGLVALAMLAVPVGRHVAESGPQPIAARVVTAQPLPPADPLPTPVRPARESDDVPPASPARDAQSPPSAAQEPTVVAGRSQRHARDATAPADRLRRVDRKTRRSGAYRQFARTTRALTRAQVVREFLAAREQVAALTGEDSGSVWLSRRQAQQRATRERARSKRQHVAAGCAPTRA